MADQITGQEPAKETEQPTEPQTIAPDAEDLKKQLADTEFKLNQIKMAQSAADKLALQYKKELEETKKATMDKAQLADFEKRQAEAEKLAFEQERKSLEREKLKFQYMKKDNIDSRFEAFLTADSEVGLKEQIETLKGLIDFHVKPVRDELEKLKADMGRPGGGTGSGTGKELKRSAFDSMTPGQQLEFMRQGGKLTD